jgi:hypothetical protein
MIERIQALVIENNKHMASIKEIQALVIENNKIIEKTLSNAKKELPVTTYFVNYFITKKDKAYGRSKIKKFYSEKDMQCFIDSGQEFFSIKETWSYSEKKKKPSNSNQCSLWEDAQGDSVPTTPVPNPLFVKLGKQRAEQTLKNKAVLSRFSTALESLGQFQEAQIVGEEGGEQDDDRDLAVAIQMQQQEEHAESERIEASHQREISSSQAEIDKGRIDRMVESRDGRVGSEGASSRTGSRKSLLEKEKCEII